MSEFHHSRICYSTATYDHMANCWERRFKTFLFITSEITKKELFLRFAICFIITSVFEN